MVGEDVQALLAQARGHVDADWLAIHGAELLGFAFLLGGLEAFADAIAHLGARVVGIACVGVVLWRVVHAVGDSSVEEGALGVDVEPPCEAVGRVVVAGNEALGEEVGVEFLEECGVGLADTALIEDELAELGPLLCGEERAAWEVGAVGGVFADERALDVEVEEDALPEVVHGGFLGKVGVFEFALEEGAEGVEVAWAILEDGAWGVLAGDVDGGLEVVLRLWVVAQALRAATRALAQEAPAAATA